MDLFIKAAAISLIVVILWLLLLKQNAEIALMLSVMLCICLFFASVTYFKSIISFFERLSLVTSLDKDMITVMLKAVGASLMSEIVSALCKDAGNAAAGKSLQILAGAVIIWISIPLLEEIMELVEDILGKI